MKALIVAHPDDEVLWFAPEKYDRIVIVHLARPDDPGQSARRVEVLKEHPLRDRIVCLGLTESNFWRDNSKRAEHEANYKALCEFLGTLQADEVTTHNACGEYGHADHIMVHHACMRTLNCPVNGQDPGMYRMIEKTYKDAGCWTWA